MSTLPTTVPEFVATMKTEEMLAEILARLQEMNTQLRSLAEPSPPSTSILTADTEEQKAATISSALVTSPSSAPPQNADPGFQSGVTELSYIHRTLPEPPVTTNGSAEQASAPAHGIPFAHGASRLENRASLEVVITTGTGSFHGGSILAASRMGARAPAPVVLSNPGMVRLSHSASWMSTTLLGIMDGGCAEGGIPIEGVDAGILRLGAAYSKKHGPYYDPVASAARLRDPFPPFPIDFTLATVKPVTELLATSPTRCSTLGLYDIACIPVSIAPSSAPSIAFPASTLSQEVVLAIPMVATMTATMTDSSLSIDKRYESCISSESYLGPYSLQVGCAAPRHKAVHHVKLSHDAARKADKILQASNDIRNGRGCRQPKPPWLLGTEVFRSWSGKMHLISGFLLEVSPWCRDYMKWVQWQPSMMPPAQLQKASSGTNLQLLPYLFIVCTGAKAKQSKFLLVLMFGICYVDLPIVHSNFQSYILVSEVLSGKPVALHFICRNGGKFLLQPWPPPDPFLALGDQFNLCGNQLVVEVISFSRR